MNFGGTRLWIATRQHLHSTAPHQLGVMSFRLGIYIYSLGLFSRHTWWFWTRCLHNYVAQKTALYRFGKLLNSVLFSEYWHIRCIRGFSDYVLHRFTIYITLLGSLEAGWAGTYPLAWGTWLTRYFCLSTIFFRYSRLGLVPCRSTLGIARAQFLPAKWPNNGIEHRRGWMAA